MNLSVEELLLLDWVLCAQGEKADPETLQKLDGWRDLRERVWRAIVRHDMTILPGPVEMEVTEYECGQLLMLLPTTFRWGTGEDVGFTLKRKCAAQLWQGDEESIVKLRAMLGGTDADSSPAASESANKDAAPHEPDGPA